MPSLILTGHPCVGKTTFARLLAARALRHPSGTVSRVVHIRESTACPDRTKAECYSDSHAEKTTRAALKSDFDRAVRGEGGGDAGGSALVILDSLNYIKGYRYELYCISKAVGERHGVVWIMGDSSDGDGSRNGAVSQSDELAKKRNRERKKLQMNHYDLAATDGQNETEVDGYYEDDGDIDDLVLRYEPPDEKNRWENPLYKVVVNNVLPWGKDGTVLETSPPPTNKVPAGDENEEERSNLLSDQMTALEVKDAPSSSPVPSKPMKKSASGFKRRGKRRVEKTAQKGSLGSPQSSTAAAATTNIPSSMASRNLTPDATADPSDGSKRKMEDVIDGILDSFLTNVAPLREGMSTFQNVSSESNALNQMDNLTQRINGDILRAQKAARLSAGVGGRIFVPLPNGGDGDDVRRAVDLSKPLFGNELRGFRRQFLKWVAGHPMPDGSKEAEMAEGYIAYIESHI